MVLAGAAAGYGGDRRRPVTGAAVRGSRARRANPAAAGHTGYPDAREPVNWRSIVRKKRENYKPRVVSRIK